jgi:hypothetical protein
MAKIVCCSIGIDTGVTMVMAENARTGFIWDTFMKNPEAARGMDRAGFKAYQLPEKRALFHWLPVAPGELQT